jgi:hypothetical protein
MITLVTIAIVVSVVSFILVVTSTIIYAKKSINIQNDYNSKFNKVSSEIIANENSETSYNTQQDNKLGQTNQTLQTVQGSYVKQTDLAKSITTGPIKATTLQATTISASENINISGNLTGNNASVNNLTASNINTNSVNIKNNSYGPWISQSNSGLGTSQEGLQLYSKSGSSINLGFNTNSGYDNALSIDSEKNTILNGKLSVSGESSLLDSLMVSKNLNVLGNLDVSGNSIFESPATFKSSAAFLQPSTFNQSITVNSDANFNGSSVFTSPISIEAPANFTKNMNVLGSSLFGDTSTFNKNTMFNNDISIKGNIFSEGIETTSGLTAPVNQEWFPINQANKQNAKNQGVLIYNGAAIVSGGGLAIGAANKIAEGSLYVRDKVKIAHNSTIAPFDTAVISTIKPNDTKTVGAVFGGPDIYSYLPNKDGNTYINPGKNNGYVSIGLDPLTNTNLTSQLNVYPPTAFVKQTYNFGPQSIVNKNSTEYGAGIAKEVNAGKIAYQLFTPDSLDIVGAGTVAGNRNVKVWDNLQTGGKIAINDNLLSLRGVNDGNHGLQYSADVDGPSLFGNGGGKLSTKNGGDAVKWDNNGNVKILGNLQICDKNGNSCRSL